MSTRVGSALRRRRDGHSLLEIVTVLALLGIFAGLLVVQARPSRAGAAVSALRGQVLQARFEAIERNAPVATVFVAEENAFVTRFAQEGEEEACSGVEIDRLRLAEFPGVRVKSVSAGGLVWLPNGTGRTCDGGGAYNQSIVLADAVREGRVIVSRAGRVRSELGL